MLIALTRSVRKHINNPENLFEMTIKDDIGQLSRNLEKLGLQQVIVENSLADDSFRVVYINKNVKQGSKENTPGKGKNKKSSS